MQRQFVLCLLGQSSFSKHLTAVRETNTLLKRAVEIRAADQGHSVKVRVIASRLPLWQLQRRAALAVWMQQGSGFV